MWLHCVEPRRTWIRGAEGVTTIGQATARPADPGQIRAVPAQVLSRLFFQLKGAWVRLCRARAKAKALASGGGRRCKGISSAAWFRVLLQHAGAVHPCTARTKSPCSGVLRSMAFIASARHSFWHAGAGIYEATDLQVAKDAVVRGSGASRPWMACARLLEPGTAESGDAHDPRTTAAPPEASQHRRFSTWPDLASLQPGEEPGFDPAAAQIRAAPQHHTSAGRRDDSGIV